MLLCGCKGQRNSKVKLCKVYLSASMSSINNKWFLKLQRSSSILCTLIMASTSNFYFYLSYSVYLFHDVAMAQFPHQNQFHLLKSNSIAEWDARWQQDKMLLRHAEVLWFETQTQKLKELLCPHWAPKPTSVLWFNHEYLAQLEYSEITYYSSPFLLREIFR